MSPRKAAILVGLALILIPRVIVAQIPGLSPPGAGGIGPLAGASGVPGASSLGGIAGVAGAAGAAPKGLCAGLKTCLAGCKQKICASAYGPLINNALTPYSTLSGGLIPQFCPTVPTDATIAALSAQGGPNSAGAVAAKVKQDEAEAKARRAAVRYLGTVDCHYWPDAEVAIISALRDDRNECVRYEAALALLNGCCCNARTIEALSIVVSGSEKDGKPSETSERVRLTALAALQSCLLRFTPEPPAPPEAPEPPEAPRPLSALDPSFRRVAYYYQTLATRPTTEVVANARATVARAVAASSRTTRPPAVGERSVYHALARANGPQPATEKPDVPRGPQSAPVLAPVPSPAPVPTGAVTGTPAPAIAPGSGLAPLAAPADAARGSSRRGVAPAPTGAEDRAVVPASASAAAPAATSHSHRGLFGIIRDAANPRPGS